MCIFIIIIIIPKLNIISYRNRREKIKENRCSRNIENVENTWVTEEIKHQITFKSGEMATQIDNITIKRNGAKVLNCKVIPGKCLTDYCVHMLI